METYWIVTSYLDLTTCGPFSTNEERNAYASVLKHSLDECADIFALDIKDGIPTIWGYSGAFWDKPQVYVKHGGYDQHDFDCECNDCHPLNKRAYRALIMHNGEAQDVTYAPSEEAAILRAYTVAARGINEGLYG